MDLLVVGIVCTAAGVVGGLVSSHVVLAFIRNAESAALNELKKAQAVAGEVKKVL